MAERRMIKSSIWEDEWFGQLGFFEQALWIGLFSRCADDQGRLLDNPVLIRAAVFPYKDIPIEEIDAALESFASAGKLLRYEKCGKRLIQLLRWWENQAPQWASASKYAPPDGWTDRVRTRANNRYVEENWKNPAPYLPPTETQPCAQPCEQSDTQAGQQDHVDDGVHLVRSGEHTRLGAQLAGHVPVPVPVLAVERGRPPPLDVESPAAQAWCRANGGLPTHDVVQRLSAMVRECEEHRQALPRASPGADVDGETWVVEAIQAAVESAEGGRFNLKYLDRILDRWQSQGFKAPYRRPGNGNRPRASPGVVHDVGAPGKDYAEGW